jgi:Cd2+/Zn2+-exporting ATPase
MREQTFTVQGMDCAHCAQTVRDGVALLPGVTACELSFVTEKLRVSGDVSAEAITERVRALGYRLADADQPPPAPLRLSAYLWQRRETRFALAALLLVLPGLLLHELFGIDHPAVNAAALAALGLTIGPVGRAAWARLRLQRSIGISGLMVIAAVGAVVIGAPVEAAVVLVLYTLGEALEGYTAQRARLALGSLTALRPQTALRRRDGRTEATAVLALNPGDVIMVRPGELLPVDGTVTAGSSTVDQSAITGESRPIDVAPDSPVYAGTRNGAGSLDVRVGVAVTETVLAKMIRLVDQARDGRAPLQRLVDRFADRYTPAVMLLALLTALLPPLIWGAPFWNPSPDEQGWLYRALTLLVVACPCALVISTPVTLVSALSAAARHGVLVKGGAVLEALAGVRALAFDKTGTLTAGRPGLTAIRAVDCPAGIGHAGHCSACDALLSTAAAVEQRSEHPLAHAVTAAALRAGLTDALPAADQVSALVGRGVRGQVAGREVVVASHRYFDEQTQHPEPDCRAAATAAAAGMTPLLVSTDGVYRGMLTVADTVRGTAQAALHELAALRLRATVMLTGDEQATAERIAAELGGLTVRSELLPHEKLAEVERLQREFGPTAMIGDGINDAAALAAARVGIAVGGGGGATTQAMETADITLLRDDLRLIPFLLRLSRRAVRVVQANVLFSIAVKLAFLVAVMLGSGSLWLAVLADVGASLLVTFNGMRLLRARPTAG